jgi:glucose dehydrogenase
MSVGPPNALSPRTPPTLPAGPRWGAGWGSAERRDTGAPLFPVEERTVPKSTVAGEVASPTQPFPVRPRPLAPSRLTADDAWG